MVNWQAYRDGVVSEVMAANSYDDAVRRVSLVVGEPVTYDALRRAWDRWYEKGLVLGRIGDSIGGIGDISLDVFDETDLVLDKFTKPPEPPRTTNVYIEPPKSGFVFSESDQHYPIHNPYIEAALVAFIRDIKPVIHVNGGDTFDCWAISSHEKEAGRIFDPGARLQQEIDSFKPYAKVVAENCEQMFFIEGNHEDRIRRLVGLNPGLFGLRALEWKNLAEMPSKTQAYPEGTRLTIGNVTWEHGNRIGPGKRTPADACGWLLKNKVERNTVFGHTHKSEMKLVTRWDNRSRPHTYFAINQGHRSDVSKQTYEQDPNWQEGFSVYEYWTMAGKTRCTPHLITIVDDSFSFGGKLYSGHKLQ